MGEPLVSVIMPAFKANDFIEVAVKSLLAQTMPDFELVMAADDGQDYIAILAEKGIRDPRIRCVSTGRIGTGPAHARNVALSKAKGRVITTLDNDDYWRSDTLELLVPMALRYGAAYSDINLVEFETGRELPNYNKRQPAGFLDLQQILSGCVHSYVWIMLDRQRVPQPRWHEHLPYINDMVLYADCSEQLGGMYYSPERLYQYHCRKGSMCNAPDTIERFIKDYISLKEQVENGCMIYSASSREIIIKYAEQWYDFEHKLQESINAGKYSEYFDFLRDHRHILQSL